MDRWNRYQLALIELPRKFKKLLAISLDVCMLPIIVYLAYVLRLGSFPAPYVHWWLVAITPLLAVPSLYVFGFYRAVVRYAGVDAIWLICKAIGFTVVLMISISYMINLSSDVPVPRSVFPIFAVLAVLYLLVSRYLVRTALHRAAGQVYENEPVAIFGAGAAGVQLATALSAVSPFVPKLFIDDSPSLRKTTIAGIPVVNRSGFERMVKSKQLKTVLLAIPGASRTQRMDVIQYLEQQEVKVKSVPALEDIVSGRARNEQIRDVSIEDLLGRDAVSPSDQLLQRSVTGKSVLVSGAAGSIGSELCRQILALSPARLVLLEVNEYGLYCIENELTSLLNMMPGEKPELICVLGSVQNGALAENAIRKHQVETIFHAAAYKHVPIVEHNVCSGVANNVLGTLEIAQAANRCGVERFILISTDKAVRPTNVMGASKRMAEMVLQAMARQQTNTVYTMVRFGNVLGSSGSVVPLFRSQIEAGGPVTVTHPEVTRYFMTIPEAAQLVIQAGAMAQGGEVFVLDMGESVKISSLAETMIHLMGYSVRDEKNPDGDIEIRYTGLRPGEKLYEELLIGDASIGTSHPMIMQAEEEFLQWQELSGLLDKIHSLLKQEDAEGIRQLLRSCVHGYQ